MLRQQSSCFSVQRVVHMSVKTLLAATWLSAGATTLWATALPETYPLGEADPAASPVDVNLAEWLDQHVEQPSPFDLAGQKFTDLLAKQDNVTRAYLTLAKANRDGNPPAAKAAGDDVLKLLGSEGEAERNDFLSHPLFPFAVLELLAVKDLAAESQLKATQAMDQYGAGSCAQKKLVFDEISKDALASRTDDQLADLLRRIDTFHSLNYRRNALRKFIILLPDQRQSGMADRVYSLAAPFPAMVNRTSWLRSLKDAKDKGDPTLGPRIRFDEVRKLAVHAQCSKARQLLVDTVKSLKNKDTLEAAVASGKAVDGCYKKRDKAQRRGFWSDFTKPMQATYGFAGWAESRLRLGHIFWGADEFAEAKQIILEVAQKSKGQSKPYEAKSVFALARIAENEAEADKAIERYRDYVARFPDGADAEEALQSLVLLYVDRAEWAQAITPLETMVKAQTALPVDQRSVGGMSFALFWAGRVYLEQNDRPRAEEMWRRVASEFYSTYYGALGHYLLEKVTNRKLALQPAHTPTFRMHALREVFIPADRQRVKRVEALMHLGLHEEAVCELEELDTADNKPEKMLLKAVMLFASGHWLDAIKIYDGLPRGFRGSLPAGFERLLFPRRYEGMITALAKKADIDPDLVMAIIRQESVFNPAARSPVGATGLMQLMPATAVMEAKRLSAGYVTEAERRTLASAARNPLALMVPETNLKIGVHHVKSLLSKWESPVFMLSAYNASPSAAARWQQTIPTKDVLAFIEKIPYKETRAYVKLVMRNYFYYKRWYNTPGDPLPHLDKLTSPLLAMHTEAPKAVPSHEAPAAPASSARH